MSKADGSAPVKAVRKQNKVTILPTEKGIGVRKAFCFQRIVIPYLSIAAKGFADLDFLSGPLLISLTSMFRTFLRTFGRAAISEGSATGGT